MSTFYPFQLACSQCQHAFTVELLAGIHATRLPEVRQQILDGTFQLFACPGCGALTAVEAPVVYTDFDRDQYIAMESTSHGDWHSARKRHVQIFNDCFVYAPPVAQELGRPLTKRLVFGLRALREKLLLWDAGLSDIVVESVKGGAVEDLGIPIDEIVLRLSRILDGGHLLFGMFEPPPRLLDESTATPVLAPLAAAHDFVTVPFERYQAAASDIAAAVRRYPWLGEEWLVDLHAGAGYLYR